MSRLLFTVVFAACVAPALAEAALDAAHPAAVPQEAGTNPYAAILPQYVPPVPEPSPLPRVLGSTIPVRRMVQPWDLAGLLRMEIPLCDWFPNGAVLVIDGFTTKLAVRGLTKPPQ